jgi:hypothetical protein
MKHGFYTCRILQANSILLILRQWVGSSVLKTRSLYWNVITDYFLFQCTFLLQIQPPAFNLTFSCRICPCLDIHEGSYSSWYETLCLSLELSQSLVHWKMSLNEVWCFIRWDLVYFLINLYQILMKNGYCIGN